MLCARRMPTTESGIRTFWFSQLYVSLGDPQSNGGLAVRVWWKPFVTLIWLGGILIAIGGLLALLGRVGSDLRRLIAREKIADRRERQGR